MTKKNSVRAMIVSFAIISGCSSATENGLTSEVEKEMYLNELNESVFSESSLDAAKERIEERGGSEFVVPAQYTSLKEKESTFFELTEADITGPYEEQDTYSAFKLEEVGMGPNYYAKHYSMLSTSGVPTYGYKVLEDGTISFSLKKFSMYVECQFQGANAEITEKITRNIDYAHETDNSITVFGEFEEYIDEEGYYGHRLKIHHLLFDELIN